jgi:hypothetical protein
VAKVFFIPFSIVGSLIAGLVARKAFDQVWSLIDDEDPPEPGDEDVGWGKLLAAAVLQSGVFALARVVSDRQARRAFLRVTGTWPGGRDDA